VDSSVRINGFTVKSDLFVSGPVRSVEV